MTADHFKPLLLPFQAPSGELNPLIDLLANPIASAYFSALEAESFYRSLKQVGPMRDFHEPLLAAINNFIEASKNVAARNLIDQLIRASRFSQNPDSSGGLLPQFQHAHSEGFGLLNLKDPISFDSLKSAYRRAVRIHHPDSGGSHNAMVAINEAYPTFHRMLEFHLNQAGGGQGPERSDASSCSSILFRLMNLALDIHLDEWNVEEAYRLFQELTTGEWNSTRWTNDKEHLLNWTNLTACLAVRLARIGLRDEAEAALVFTRKGFAESIKRGLTYGFVLKNAEESVASGQKFSVQVLYPRQAIQALRLGLISTDKVTTVQARMDRKHEEMRQREIDFLAYRSQAGLLQDLLPDRCACGRVNRSKLVPEPEYFQTQIQALTPDQQGEYLEAFGPNGPVELVRKYHYVRIQSLLETIIMNPPPATRFAIAREAKALGSLMSRKPDYWALQVADLAIFFESLPVSEQRERCLLLTQLHERRTRDGTLSFDLFGFSPKLRDDYFDLVMRPLEHLRVALRKGRLPALDPDKQARLREDFAKLATPEMKEWSARAIQASIHLAKADPEKAAEIFASHCKRLRLLGAELYDPSQAQLGYWIDRLTVALVRLNRWQEAREWLVDYFQLDPQFRLRSSPSEEEGLKKRMARCEKELGRNAR